MYIWKSDYFCGNKVSDYGLENGYVDYATLAKSFDAVLNNEIIPATQDIGYWDLVNGNEYYYEIDGEIMTEEEKESKIEEIRELLDQIEDVESEEYQALEEKLEELETAEEYYYDVFQYYIISDNGARILSDYTNEIVWYNEKLDMYVWGVTHCGTSWDYVLTDIKIEKESD